MCGRACHCIHLAHLHEWDFSIPPLPKHALWIVYGRTPLKILFYHEGAHHKWLPPPGGGAVPFWRWRVCKVQKTPFFSIAVTHGPHIFYSCMSSHPKTHIFAFNLSHNAPWFEKLAFEKKILCRPIPTTPASDRIPGSTRTMLFFKYHTKTLLFCELLALTRWPHIFLCFSLTECQKSCSHPMTPHFLSLCSHRMPQPVGGRALHPYPLHIWLPPPGPHPQINNGPTTVGSLLHRFYCARSLLTSKRLHPGPHRIIHEIDL